MLSCFCSSSLLLHPVESRQCAVWQSSGRWGPESSRWATGAQQGSSFPSSAEHQSCTVWPYSTLISRGVRLSFPVALFHFVCVSFCVSWMQTDRKTHVWQCSSEGRAFVPVSQFVLVLLCFTVQAYISKQPMSSCFQNGLQDAFSST